MPNMPKFATEEELAAWIEKNDTASFMDDMEDAKETFAIKRIRFALRPPDVRLHTELYEALETAAAREGIPYQMPVQRWLREKLSEEAPDLMSEPSGND